MSEFWESVSKRELEKCLQYFDENCRIEFDSKKFQHRHEISQFLKKSLFKANVHYVIVMKRENQMDNGTEYRYYVQGFSNTWLIGIYEVCEMISENSKMIMNLQIETRQYDTKKCQSINFGSDYVKNLNQTMRKPKRIILLRHGETLGNIQHDVYSKVPDNKIDLTERGCKQAETAGIQVKHIVGNQSVKIYYSPFKRTTTTLKYFVKAWDQPIEQKVEPLLRDQEMGNYAPDDNLSSLLNDRREFGSFYWRFNNGESGSDVNHRMIVFTRYLERKWQKKQMEENIVLISHGMTCRMFLMAFFGWSIETFNSLLNFEHGEICVLELQQNGKYLIKSLVRSQNPKLLPSYDCRKCCIFHS